MDRNAIFRLFYPYFDIRRKYHPSSFVERQKLYRLLYGAFLILKV